MPTFDVDVSKDYRNRRTDATYTVEGVIRVEAASQADANGLVKQWMINDPSTNRPLQTIDPRIEWDDTPGDGDDYVDFTFDVI